MARAVDGEVVFSVSRWKTGFLVLAGIGMTAGALWIISARLAPAGSFKEAMVWLGVPFFGLVTLKLAHTLVKGGAVVTVGADGIRDTRVSPDLVPWAAVQAVRPVVVQYQDLLMLELDPAFEAQMHKSRLARLFGPANAALGYKGLAISANGLDGSFAELAAAVQRYRGV